jgi:hypothetical protein
VSRDFRRLVFTDGFGPRDEFETPLRGYRADVVAQLEDDSEYPMSFYDPTRLKQVLEDEIADGSRFFTEVGLVIVPEVTRETMEKAARELCRQGFFDSLRPRSSK